MSSINYTRILIDFYMVLQRDPILKGTTRFSFGWDIGLPFRRSCFF